ncbi:pilus assembly protein CpaC [Rhodobium orientis]|uniref:Pilus assembly protein n=1 Tax=Rhodobium orientis TaxID=34017 RepID=A0A327JX89_9HYPH|nr:type II and III secretion system protein family protein [Rhodobium orientis]MBB4304651.1 pilus assembly protein CpaC [Rhodobium orientis]MBK5950026.1 pilus assembly protein [Rhodobium orientis]RAI27718.1 pilus assembly protein [Rhodobium orientis]
MVGWVKRGSLPAPSVAVALALALVVAFVVLAGPGTAFAGSNYPKVIRISKADAGVTRPLNVGLNKSVVVELDEDVRDVLVSSPEIADAVVRNSRRVYILGVAFGQANVFLFGDGGRQIAAFDLSVEPDTGDLARAIRRVIPDSAIEVEAVNGSIILRGSAASPVDAKRATDIAAKFVGNDVEKVVNTIAVAGKEQVHLKVTIAEVQRSIIKQLGVDLRVAGQNGRVAFDVLTENPFSTNGTALSSTAGAFSYAAGGTTADATIRALQEDGVIRTLAEPTLTAISGEKADFLVGGEFPVPVGYDNGEVSIEFKPYGVSLDFTPVVLTEGNISLHVKTEVSELTNEGAITLSTTGLTIPALRVRRANTTVEMPSGSALVLAGLIKDDIRQSIAGVPGLMQVPVLGALFKSRDFQRSQTELVVFVTPYVVNPVSPKKITRPDKNFNPPSDAAGYFLNRLNRTYRIGGGETDTKYYGRFGFIYE